MDIKHLHYFIAIVQHNFNLTKAAQSLYITQPTLSAMINDFERAEEITLFNRKSGRISGLTLEGEIYYNDALKITQLHNQMHHNLHNAKTTIAGNIRIGIPPLVFSVVFSKILPEMIMAYPEIEFSYYEKGAEQLGKDILTGDTDLAVLLDPESHSSNLIKSYNLVNSELVLVLSEQHNYANKDKIEWSDLHNQRMATFGEEFTTTRLVENQCARNGIFPHIVFQSTSWEFILNTVSVDSNLMTILPLPIAKLLRFSNLITKPIVNPIPWKVNLCRFKKDRYSNLENFVLDHLLSRFPQENNNDDVYISQK